MSDIGYNSLLLPTLNDGLVNFEDVSVEKACRSAPTAMPNPDFVDF
jgi:hypothetical protein